MTAKEQLIQELEQVPESLAEELLDFLLFTKARRNLTVTQSTPDGITNQKKPIWERFEEFADQMPDEIAVKLPTDGAAQLDHYLYGSSKREV
jgi:hypothetical protein